MKLVARLALGAALLGFAGTAMIMIVLHKGNEPKVCQLHPKKIFQGMNSKCFDVRKLNWVPVSESLSPIDSSV